MPHVDVHVMYEYGIDLRPHCSSYVRLILPLTYPSGGRDLSVTFGRSYRKSDILILERLLRPDVTAEFVEGLTEQARRDGAQIIYQIDDNLLDLAWNTPFLSYPMPAHKGIVRYLTREADGVITSTPALANRLQKLNNRIKVVPNAIDDRLYRYRPSHLSLPGSPKVIGYMGTLTHDTDIMMAAQALRAVMRRYDVVLEIVGGFVDPAIREFFAGLPVRYLDVGGSHEYPSFIRWMVANARWDLAVAPLEATPFTNCKSDLKFLDYSALGFPGVYSQVPPYDESVEHMETGYLAQNSVGAWIEALERLLNDDTLRSYIADKARGYVFSKRTLPYCASLWRDIIHGFVSSGGAASSA